MGDSGNDLPRIFFDFSWLPFFGNGRIDEEKKMFSLCHGFSLFYEPSNSGCHVLVLYEVLEHAFYVCRFMFQKV